jgi:hypothetical protein
VAENRGDRIIQTLLYGGSFLAIAAALWILPMTIAHGILPRSTSNERLSLGALDAARVGCVLIGLWLLVQKFYTFVSFLLTASFDPDFAFAAVAIEVKVDLAVSVCEFLLGVFLVLRSDVFARVITNARPFQS